MTDMELQKGRALIATVGIVSAKAVANEDWPLQLVSIR